MSRVNCLWPSPHSRALAMFAFAIAVPTSAAAQPATPKAGVEAINVEGCLTQDVSRGQSSAEGQYVLMLQPVGAAAPAAAPASSNGGVVPAPALPKMYALRTTDDHPVTLPPLVNHRVRVEGTSTAAATTSPLAGRSPEATPFPAAVSTGSADAGATGTPFDRANLPTIVVRTITSLATTCTAGS
jgi:hypothetical protein